MELHSRSVQILNTRLDFLSKTVSSIRRIKFIDARRGMDPEKIYDPPLLDDSKHTAAKSVLTLSNEEIRKPSRTAPVHIAYLSRHS